MTGNYPIIEELRMRSRALGLDLKEIGRRCGLAETSLRAWEKGKSTTSRLGLKISQRALGELVGGSRESVNKHLQDLKRSGIIAIEKGAILIRDFDALTDLA